MRGKSSGRAALAARPHFWGRPFSSFDKFLAEELSALAGLHQRGELLHRRAPATAEDSQWNSPARTTASASPVGARPESPLEGVSSERPRPIRCTPHEVTFTLLWIPQPPRGPL